MGLEHQVWGTPRGKRRQVLFAAFAPQHWQWAEKYAARLADRGLDNVEIRDEEWEDDEDEEEEPHWAD